MGSGTSCPSSTKVSCTMWEGADVKKAELTVLDISAAIIRKVEALPESNDYFYIGIFFSMSIALLPLLWRMQNIDWSWLREVAAVPMVTTNSSQLLVRLWSSLELEQPEAFIVVAGLVERFSLAFFLFFLLSIAERTFKQRFLLAKHFCHLTSARRARRSELPHFRLNKVRNIKIWLSVRSYLRKHGPQRSVDMIVSSAYLITLFIISFLCFELLKESDVGFYRQLLHIELTAWSFSTAVFLLRFMTLGAKINKKYRNLSVLITEQMEQKPQKKEELILAHNVLKLATDLLKELESPFKISGFSANPILYNITKLAFLSAASGALSELLGFKLKLYKIKFRG